MEDNALSQTQAQRTLTKDVREYFLSNEVFAEYERIAEELALTGDDAVSLLSSLVYRFVGGALSIDELKMQIRLEFLLPEPKVNQLISSVFLHVLSPIAQSIPGLGDELIAWGQSTSQAGEPMTALTFIRYFINSLGRSLESVEQHRLEMLLQNYLDKQKTREELVNFLQRPHKLGGMEMDENSAKELVEAFEVQRAAVKLESGEIKEAEVVHFELGAVEEPSEQKKSDVFSEEDEQEIQAIAEQTQEVRTQPLPSKPEDLVATICQSESFVFEDPQLQNRCLEIVEARVRGVRDAFQTRAAFERPVESGGLGLTGRRLADVMEQIEKSVETFERVQREKFAKEREAARVMQKEKQQQRSELEVQEQKILAKRYVQTTGKLPTEAVAPAAPALSRTSAALSAHLQLQQQQSKIDAQKVRSVVEKSTVQPVQLPKTISRPRVQDIHSAPRLSGPIDELQSMGLIEFRRLAKDPGQAIDRLKDIVNLLEEQGYSKRVEGVKALRSSPLMRLYGSVTQKALVSGMSLDDVLQREAQGMKKEEFLALMKLNADLRF